MPKLSVSGVNITGENKAVTEPALLVSVAYFIFNEMILTDHLSSIVHGPNGICPKREGV